MNNAEIEKFQYLPPSIGSRLRLIVLVSPPVYFVRLRPICRRYRGTLGRNGSASPMRRPSIFLLKHCLRGFVYCTSTKFPRPNSFLFSSQYVCLCVVSRPENKRKQRRKKKTKSIQFNFNIRWHPPHFNRPSFSILLQHYLSYLDRCAPRSPIPSPHLLLSAAALPAGGDSAALTRP